MGISHGGSGRWVSVRSRLQLQSSLVHLQSLSPYCVWKVLNKEHGLRVRWIGIAGCMCILNYVIQEMGCSKEGESILVVMIFSQCLDLTKHVLDLLSWKWFVKNNVESCFLVCDTVVTAETWDLWFFFCACADIWNINLWKIILICIEMHWKITSSCSIGPLIFIAKFLHLWAWIASVSLTQTEWVYLPSCICILKVINSKQAKDTMMVDAIQSCKAVVVANMWNYFYRELLCL